MLTQIIIFGASGDLTARKLIPGLLASHAAGLFRTAIQVIGVARRPKSDPAWRDELAGWIEPDAQAGWADFAPHLFYRDGDVRDPASAQALLATLDGLAHDAGVDPSQVGRLFYLALKPDLFAPVVTCLANEGMLAAPLGETVAWRRVVVEKPFGTDLASAKALNLALRAHLHEEQILRIDHYLGKETVQNILTFRFQNAIFEPLWNSRHVESVEISVCESLGMEAGRGAYYDGAGALRDMLQNHLLQILAMVAMEPPNSMDPDAIRAEKVKVLQALAPLAPETIERDLVRGQYEAGAAGRGYREESGVPADSHTETFVAVRANIANWRWNQVPFLLRTGKRLDGRYTQVVLRFRTPPVDLLNGPVADGLCALRPNALRLLIQPDEGIRLSFLVKQPGPGMVMRPAELSFDYSSLGTATAPAYQRLLLDAIHGNPTLFIRGDEAEAAWRFADSLRQGWLETRAPVMSYASGSGGPLEADALFRGCEGTWSRAEPQP